MLRRIGGPPEGEQLHTTDVTQVVRTQRPQHDLIVVAQHVGQVLGHHDRSGIRDGHDAIRHVDDTAVHVTVALEHAAARQADADVGQVVVVAETLGQIERQRRAGACVRRGGT